MEMEQTQRTTKKKRRKYLFTLLLNRYGHRTRYTLFMTVSLKRCETKQIKHATDVRKTVAAARTNVRTKKNAEIRCVFACVRVGSRVYLTYACMSLSMCLMNSECQISSGALSAFPVCMQMRVKSVCILFNVTAHRLYVHLNQSNEHRTTYTFNGRVICVQCDDLAFRFVFCRFSQSCNQHRDLTKWAPSSHLHYFLWLIPMQIANVKAAHTQYQCSSDMHIPCLSLNSRDDSRHSHSFERTYTKTPHRTPVS